MYTKDKKDRVNEVEGNEVETNLKRTPKRRLSRSVTKLLLSNLLLLLGIVYSPMLQVCLGAVVVLSTEGIFEMDDRRREE